MTDSLGGEKADQRVPNVDRPDEAKPAPWTLKQWERGRRSPRGLALRMLRNILNAALVDKPTPSQTSAPSQPAQAATAKRWSLPAAAVPAPRDQRTV